MWCLQYNLPLEKSNQQVNFFPRVTVLQSLADYTYTEFCSSMSDFRTLNLSACPVQLIISNCSFSVIGKVYNQVPEMLMAAKQSSLWGQDNCNKALKIIYPDCLLYAYKTQSMGKTNNSFCPSGLLYSINFPMLLTEVDKSI